MREHVIKITERTYFGPKITLSMRVVGRTLPFASYTDAASWRLARYQMPRSVTV